MNESYTISKITLGTVQLGLPYGVANINGQPTRDYSNQLLQYALNHGIRSLDTARTYGNAEDIVGGFENAGDFTVISKFKLSDAALNNESLAIEEAKESITTSCRKLRTEKIPIVLFHQDRNQPMKKLMQVLPSVFQIVMNEGLVGKSGISVSSPEDLKDIQDWSTIHSVQVPLSIFDTRLLQDDILQVLKESKVTVFVRSIYLQGLLIMGEATLPENLSFAKPYLHRLKEIAARANYTTKELAFAFARDTHGVNSIVIGAETIEQLDENIQLLSVPPIPDHVYAEIKDSFTSIPEKLMTPALWNK